MQEFVTRIRDIYYFYFVHIFKEYNKFIEPIEIKDKERDDIRKYFKHEEFISKNNKTDFYKELFDTRMWIVFLEMKVAKEQLKADGKEDAKEENKQSQLTAYTRDLATIETFDNYIENFIQSHKNSIKKIFKRTKQFPWLFQAREIRKYDDITFE